MDGMSHDERKAILESATKECEMRGKARDVDGRALHILAERAMRAERERDALITRLRAAEARTAWQPIETADEGPFDEPQLVCMPSGRYAVARYDGRRWWNEDGSPIATPAARMPIPAPPVSEVPRD